MNALVLALDELRTAQDFHDRVRAAPLSDQLTVGQDHHNRLDAAVRAVVTAYAAEPQHKDAAEIDPLDDVDLTAVYLAGFERGKDTVCQIATPAAQGDARDDDRHDMTTAYMAGLERGKDVERERQVGAQGDAEPVYQIREFDERHAPWFDVTANQYNDTRANGRRIVYAAPRPASDDAHAAGRDMLKRIDHALHDMPRTAQVDHLHDMLHCYLSLTADEPEVRTDALREYRETDWTMPPARPAAWPTAATEGE